MTVGIMKLLIDPGAPSILSGFKVHLRLLYFYGDNRRSAMRKFLAVPS
jgi:hypothetical protein